ncbi:MAG: transposase [Beijerinckiaceae bacterium]
MARLARIVLPDAPHHVMQGAVEGRTLFADDGDYALYRDLIAERCAANSVACWAWCFLPDRVHLILSPATEDGLARAVGEAHRRYTAFVNIRARRTGNLFKGRFTSLVMDEANALRTVQTLAFAPVRSRLAAYPELWRWSSVKAHLSGESDGLVDVRPMLDRRPRFRAFIDLSIAEQRALQGFDGKGMNGRPLGDAAFIDGLEAQIGRSVRRGRPGRKKKSAVDPA